MLLEVRLKSSSSPSRDWAGGSACQRAGVTFGTCLGWYGQCVATTHVTTPTSRTDFASRLSTLPTNSNEWGPNGDLV